MKKEILIMLALVSLLLITGCTGQVPYTDGSCGSLCIQNECRRENTTCGINGLGEIQFPSSEAAEYCLLYCHTEENITVVKQ